jgi:TolB-like protein
MLSFALLLVSLSQGCGSRYAQEVPIAGDILCPFFSGQIIDDVSRSLAKQIASPIKQRIRIGVIPLLDQTYSAHDLSLALSERLTTHLFKLDSFEVVEKTRMDAVLAELNLHETGAFDPDTVKRIGMRAGVDAIVTGTITSLHSYYGVDCRLIDIRTSTILSAANAKVLKSIR